MKQPALKPILLAAAVMFASCLTSYANAAPNNPVQTSQDTTKRSKMKKVKITKRDTAGRRPKQDTVR
ncbi:MAG: hypothetical protein EOP42_21855 [Sphingobacteriaceae bacterium]|nr:MAG: hypothetical protein EOP42_21855 [Sphingobacteriaceae bacterium]